MDVTTALAGTSYFFALTHPEPAIVNTIHTAMGLEVAHQRARVVPEQDRADTLVGGRDEDRAERALADGEADRSPRPPARYVVGVMPRASGAVA